MQHSERLLLKTNEERLETKRMKNLQKEISRLKKENAQLRKKNMRLENTNISRSSKELLYEESEISENLEPVLKKSKQANKTFCSNSYCDSCDSSSVTEIPAGYYLVLVCQSCGERSKKPIEDTYHHTDSYQQKICTG